MRSAGMKPPSAPRHPRSAAAVLVVAAAVISGCQPPSLAGTGQSSATRDYTFTMPVSSLIVNDRTGSVSVNGGSGSEVSVTAAISYQTAMPSITHTVSGQALTLGYTSCTSCGVKFTVTVPRAASVAVHLGTGDATVGGVAGDVSVGDDTGKVTMTSLTGDVTVQGGTGSVHGAGLTGARASFQNVTGSVDVAFAAAPRQLSAISGTGRVSVSVPAGTAYQVNASSKVGPVRVSVPQSPAATHVITAATNIGTVSVSNG
jgi:hypothetical protein